MKNVLLLIIILLTLTACSLNRTPSPLVNEKSATANMGNYSSTDVINRINEINNGLTPIVKSTKKNATSVESNQAQQQPPQQQRKSLENLAAQYSAATLKTNYGEIKVKFYDKESPVTVNNFLNLAKTGFYDGTKFHRVIKDFMVQGGDPLSKDNDPTNDGNGGPGYQFQDEINQHKLVRGSLAMANSGPNTNGSQFFIVTASSTPWLDDKHTNFGYVIEGMGTVDKIAAVQTDSNDRPKEDVIINSIELGK